MHTCVYIRGSMCMCMQPLLGRWLPFTSFTASALTGSCHGRPPAGTIHMGGALAGQGDISRAGLVTDTHLGTCSYMLICTRAHTHARTQGSHVTRLSLSRLVSLSWHCLFLPPSRSGPPSLSPDKHCPPLSAPLEPSLLPSWSWKVLRASLMNMITDEHL